MMVRNPTNRDTLLTGAAQQESPKRAAIIDAAAELFLHSGFGDVSMDAISAKAEVSKRTVYSHFPGKEALFSAVMRRHCDRFLEFDVYQFDDEADPAEVLRDIGRRFVTLVTSSEAVALFRTVVAEAGRFPELGKTFSDTGPERWIAVLSPYLAEQTRRGRLNIPEPEAAATELLHLLKDPLHMRCILGVQQAVSEAEVDAHVSDAVGRFLKLYRAA